MMIPLKMLTGVESNDGFKFDFHLGLSQKFNVGSSWYFSNSQPSNFSLNAMFSPNMSPLNMSKVNMINVKKDINGRMEVMGNYYITDSIAFKVEGMLQSANLAEAHL